MGLAIGPSRSVLSNPDVSHLMFELERVRLSTKDKDGTHNVAYAVAKDEPDDSAIVMMTMMTM